jgi:hypothetical protein
MLGSRITHKTALTSITALAVFASLALFSEKPAAACGGCFHEQGENNTVITDHRMAFSISMQQTTLYDQIRYQGNPTSFAWVLPIKGTATVGVSSDAVFQTLDPATGVQVFAPPKNCPPPPFCPGNVDAGAGGGSLGADASSSGGGVDVLASETVGPYETVQLHSSDPTALQTWLAQHGYSIPSDVAPIVTAYINDGFDFLAVKLVPNAGISAMKPIRVTTPGASVQLPLRMVAAGAGANIGITLWVIGDGRWEAQNFPNFTIGADELVWDWGTNSSNYATLRAQKNTASGGAAWQSESSQSLSTQQLSTAIRFASRGYDPTTQTQRDDYAPSPSSSGDAGAGEGGASDGGAPMDADAAFMADMVALFGNDPVGQIRITRMRSDLPKASLANDLVLQAAADQSDLPTVLQVTQESGQPSVPCTTTNARSRAKRRAIKRRRKRTR